MLVFAASVLPLSLCNKFMSSPGTAKQQCPIAAYFQVMFVVVLCVLVQLGSALAGRLRTI